mmetsp:Transcript_1912/g.2758  ORF Transcript_1912/g.2758 Transcript_1912/m.2758 type:complete len:94 (+) Transcript_1912:185-466(+)
MLEKTNIMALVGDGTNPRWRANEVNFWDENLGSVVDKVQLDDSPILAVKLSRYILVVVQSEEITVFNFQTLNLLDNIETAPNPTGIIAFITNE